MVGVYHSARSSTFFGPFHVGTARFHASANTMIHTGGSNGIILRVAETWSRMSNLLCVNLFLVDEHYNPGCNLSMVPAELWFVGEKFPPCIQCIVELTLLGGILLFSLLWRGFLRCMFLWIKQYLFRNIKSYIYYMNKSCLFWALFEVACPICITRLDPLLSRGLLSQAVKLNTAPPLCRESKQK